MFVAPLFGFFLPLCECGIIPVAGRLTRKGVPLGVAVSFMLANPILNPFLLFSTRLAFPNFPQMVSIGLASAYASEEFLLARLIVTCHVAHAQPDGLLVIYLGSARLTRDSWVTVRGRLELADFAGIALLKIRASEVISVSPLADAYVYAW